MTVDIKGLGKITANKETLCTLCSIFYHYGRFMKESGIESYENTSYIYKRHGETIFDALKEAGYYGSKGE